MQGFLGRVGMYNRGLLCVEPLLPYDPFKQEEEREGGGVGRNLKGGYLGPSWFHVSPTLRQSYSESKQRPVPHWALMQVQTSHSLHNPLPLGT